MTQVLLLTNEHKDAKPIIGAFLKTQRHTLAARGLEEPCASFPDFCDNR